LDDVWLLKLQARLVRSLVANITSALFLLPAGAGMRGVAAGATASVDIHIQRYTSDEETQRFAQQLIEGRLQVMKVRHFIPTKSSMACTSMPGSQLERGLSNAAVFIGQ